MKIIIRVESGIITEVLSDHILDEVIIVDHDIDGCDIDDIVEIYGDEVALSYTDVNYEKEMIDTICEVSDKYLEQVNERAYEQDI